MHQPQLPLHRRPGQVPRIGLDHLRQMLAGAARPISRTLETAEGARPDAHTAETQDEIRRSYARYAVVEHSNRFGSAWRTLVTSIVDYFTASEKPIGIEDFLKDNGIV